MKKLTYGKEFDVSKMTDEEFIEAFKVLYERNETFFWEMEYGDRIERLGLYELCKKGSYIL